jgi:hypothetical protein
MIEKMLDIFDLLVEGNPLVESSEWDFTDNNDIEITIVSKSLDKTVDYVLNKVVIDNEDYNIKSTSREVIFLEEEY